MNTEIERRREIILSMKSNLGDLKKGIDKTIRRFVILDIVNKVLALICFLLLIVMMASDFFGLDSFSWNDSGIIVVVSLSIVLRLPSGIYDVKLLRHLKFIEGKQDKEGIDKLNEKLYYTLKNKINKNYKFFIMVSVLMLFIFVTAVIQAFTKEYMLNEFTKTALIVFWGLVIFNYTKTVKILNRNINDVESKYKVQ
ncbi:MAG: hypothetical protein HRT66_05840 [Flavobacteriaceae bacterium]|nr:hypothetical protein [Flavobacteriaceae bacterium]